MTNLVWLCARLAHGGVLAPFRCGLEWFQLSFLSWAQAASKILVVHKYTEILSVLWYKDLPIYLVALLMCATVRYKYCSNENKYVVSLMCTEKSIQFSMHENP